MATKRSPIVERTQMLLAGIRDYAKPASTLSKVAVLSAFVIGGTMIPVFAFDDTLKEAQEKLLAEEEALHLEEQAMLAEEAQMALEEEAMVAAETAMEAQEAQMLLEEEAIASGAGRNTEALKRLL